MKSVEGVYRDGKVELSALPDNVCENAPVIVTFVETDSVNLEHHGISERESRKLRDTLASFAEEWESPEMAAYDDYATAKARKNT